MNTRPPTRGTGCPRWLPTRSCTISASKRRGQRYRVATDAMAASRRCRRAMLVALCVARVSGAFPAGHATCCSEEKKCCGQTFPPPKSHACAEGHRCCVGDCDAVSLETVVARPARVRFRAPAPAPARPRRSRRRCRARATPTASGSRSARPRPRNRRRSPPAKPPPSPRNHRRRPGGLLRRLPRRRPGLPPGLRRRLLGRETRAARAAATRAARATPRRPQGVARSPRTAARATRTARASTTRDARAALRGSVARAGDARRQRLGGATAGGRRRDPGLVPSRSRRTPKGGPPRLIPCSTNSAT